MRRDEHVAAMQQQKREYERRIADLESEIKAYQEAKSTDEMIAEMSDDVLVNAKNVLMKLERCYYTVLGMWQNKLFTKDTVTQLIEKCINEIKSEVVGGSIDG